MTTPLASAKSILREQVRARLRTITEAERATASAQLCAQILAQSIWKDTETVLLFSPIGDEPDIRPVIERCWQTGRRIAFLRHEVATQSYVACVVKSDGEMMAGRFGVMEPTAGCPVVPLNQLDLVLAPGVAFDLTGLRLGRGKGFYDRLLAGVRGHKCGVAFDLQVVAQVPEEPHDVRVDSILTPTRWRLCRRAA